LFIGPFPQAAYTNISVPFDDGDKLLLYTDSIVEANPPDGQEFGLEGLEALLLASGGQQPETFLEMLFRRI
jgi:serine phosphatase RsbU (regulator of sigma subunit)